MDVNSDGKVDKSEYETAMLAVMEHLDDEVFDLGIERTLTAVTFADASRAEKLKMVFDKCDADADGRLDMDELRALANSLIVGGDETKVRRTMKWLDANGDDVLTFEEFAAPMLAATAPVDDDRFDAAVRRILAADGDATEPDAADALHAKLAAYVASLETHATTRQISTRDLDVLLKDKTKKVGVVDCRPAEERAVSALDLASRGAAAARTSVAVVLGDVAFVDAVDNNIAALVDSNVELEQLETCDVIVCFSAFGEAGRRRCWSPKDKKPIAATVRRPVGSTRVALVDPAREQRRRRCTPARRRERGWCDRGETRSSSGRGGGGGGDAARTCFRCTCRAKKPRDVSFRRCYADVRGDRLLHCFARGERASTRHRGGVPPRPAHACLHVLSRRGPPARLGWSVGRRFQTADAPVDLEVAETHVGAGDDPPSRGVGGGAGGAVRARQVLPALDAAR